MKKVILLIVAGLFFMSGAAIAVPSGKTLEFTKSPMGKVTFSGTEHAEAGIKCKECHNPEMFPKMKQGTVKITMSKIYAGELCGKCHNGKRAFEAKKNCARCHKH
ncbi:c(7)-type cytochrome triheme domain-containing protein [Geopsychrobacter electrodiphilus]|uniref:c(7)-type cytochrome triheme domain-containing protein n=1 Tax=Geopsychrobacter electrodiphilus TaxID=225196 RepID=UPI000380C679|nr:c(7)-type cytochrome triheme domain-containing protein [Geopsychrobacter electrodiphilus]